MLSVVSVIESYTKQTTAVAASFSASCHMYETGSLFGSTRLSWGTLRSHRKYPANWRLILCE